ncbi:MAG: gamma-glutamyltransferase family protein, partial [Candidatus Hodarchaeales archaeon]
SIPLTGFIPITVPGAVSLWDLIHEKYGKLPWKTVLEPAIRYAREGFPLSPVIAQVWGELVPKLLKTEGATKTYLINDERAPRVGEIFRQNKLALTLEKIAENGSEEFYKGEIAQRIEEFMEKNGGFVKYSDLKNYQAEWTQPIVRDFYNHLLWEHGPNGQGLVTLMMLAITEELDISRYPHNSVEYLHCLIEAKKLAFSDGFEYIADPEHMQYDSNKFLTEEYAQARASQVNPHHAFSSPPPPMSFGEDTVYLTAVDDEGLVVSFINSLFYGFGSGIVDPELGVAFQNRGAGFTLKKGHPNQYSPGKRPYHTIIPAMVTSPEDEFLYSFGVMGGHHQPQGQAQVFLNMVLFGMDPQAAIDEPRFHHDQNSNTISLESPITVSTRMKLRQKGHTIIDCVGTNFGGGQIIKYDKELDSFCAGSDPRKDGQAQGY